MIGREGHTVGPASGVRRREHIDRARGPGQKELLPVLRAAGWNRADELLGVLLVPLVGSNPATEIMISQEAAKEDMKAGVGGVMAGAPVSAIRQGGKRVEKEGPLQIIVLARGRAEEAELEVGQAAAETSD